MSRPFWGITLVVAAILWAILPRLIDSEPRLTIHDAHYDPRLSSIDSLDAAEKALPKFVVNTGHPQKDIADGIERMLVMRFAHGFSRLSVRENWIAHSISGMMIRAGFANDGTTTIPKFDTPVRPDDILKHSRAMCSQQMMVFQALLARNHIDYARVSFMQVPSHDALAAKVDGVWRFYDSDMRPTRTGVPLTEVLQGEVLPAMYPMIQDGVNMGQHFRDLARERQILVRDIDVYPASRGALFQQLTKFISKWGWILPLSLGAWLMGRRRNVRRALALQS